MYAERVVVGGCMLLILIISHAPRPARGPQLLVRKFCQALVLDDLVIPLQAAGR